MPPARQCITLISHSAASAVTLYESYGGATGVSPIQPGEDTRLSTSKLGSAAVTVTR
jgi:hypothetical protein